MKWTTWMFMPLRRYADFKGRSGREEFWWFVLLQMVVLVPLYVLAGGGAPGAGLSPLYLVFLVLALGLFIPGLAVQVRRFHDQARTGWFTLLALIPFVGGLILLVFNCLEGTIGPNRFGPDPAADPSATFS